MEVIKDLSLNRLQQISSTLEINIIDVNDIDEHYIKIINFLRINNINNLEYYLLKKKWENIELLHLFNINNSLIPDCYKLNNIGSKIQCLTDDSNNGFTTIINYEKNNIMFKGVLKSIKLTYEDEEDEDDEDEDEEDEEDEDEEDEEDEDEEDEDEEDEDDEDEEDEEDEDEDEDEEHEDSKPDNLYYEYLVGQCINKLSMYFPNFVKTYCAGMYNTPEYHEFLYSSCEKKELKNLPQKFSTMVNEINSDNIEKNIINSCNNWSQMILITQWLPVFCNLNDFLSKNSVGEKDDDFYEIGENQELIMIEYIKLLFIIYLTLSSLKDHFTHYDLHEENILLIKVPNNKYISLIYQMPNGNIHTINTRYIPIFIDYGRSYVNCDSPILNSTDIFNMVCKNKKNCPTTCGDTSGYSFAGIQKSDNTFDNTDIHDYFINSAKRNFSHDLRLMADIKKFYNFANLDSSIDFINLWKILLINLNYDSSFGTPEKEISDEPESVYNVTRVYEELNKILSDHSFIERDNITNDYEKFGDVNVITDMSTEFIFTPN
jgi:hypothetical protein